MCVCVFYLRVCVAFQHLSELKVFRSTFKVMVHRCRIVCVCVQVCVWHLAFSLEGLRKWSNYKAGKTAYGERDREREREEDEHNQKALPHPPHCSCTYPIFILFAFYFLQWGHWRMNNSRAGKWRLDALYVNQIPALPFISFRAPWRHKRSQKALGRNSREKLKAGQVCANIFTENQAGFCEGQSLTAFIQAELSNNSVGLQFSAALTSPYTTVRIT